MPSLVIGNTGAFIGDALVGGRFEFLLATLNASLDSAQSEAAGWDAVVKGNIPASAVVMTSRSVITITLPAFGTYDITAQETITANLIAGLINGVNLAILGSPTFTIDPGGAPPAATQPRKSLMGVGF
jgi:hypothetical protein